MNKKQNGGKDFDEGAVSVKEISVYDSGNYYGKSDDFEIYGKLSRKEKSRREDDLLDDVENDSEDLLTNSSETFYEDVEKYLVSESDSKSEGQLLNNSDGYLEEEENYDYDYVGNDTNYISKRDRITDEASENLAGKWEDAALSNFDRGYDSDIDITLASSENVQVTENDIDEVDVATTARGERYENDNKYFKSGERKYSSTNKTRTFEASSYPSFSSTRRNTHPSEALEDYDYYERLTEYDGAEYPSWFAGEDGESLMSKEIDDKFNRFFERCNYIQHIISTVLVSELYLRKTRDIQIQVGDTVFDTHRFLLLHHAEALGKKTLESGDKFLFPMTGVTSSCFRIIYRWMYGLKVTLGGKDGTSRSTITVPDLITAANHLGFHALAEECAAAAQQARQPISAPAMYLHGQQLQGGKLSKIGYRLMRDHFDQVIRVKEFLSLPFNVIIRLLSDEFLRVTSETIVLEAALLWLGHNWDSRLHLVPEVIATVRFELMSIPELFRVTDLPMASSDAAKAKVILTRPFCVDKLLGAYKAKLVMTDCCEDLCAYLSQKGISIGRSNSRLTADHRQLIHRSSRSMAPIVERRRASSPGRGKSRIINHVTSELDTDIGAESSMLMAEWERTWVQMQLNSYESRRHRLWSIFQSLQNSLFRKVTCEAEFLVEGVVYPVHRFLLVYHAPQLAAISKAGIPQNRIRIDMKGIPTSAFLVIYKWMYGQLLDVGWKDDIKKRDILLRKIQFYADQMGFKDFVPRCYLYEGFSTKWKKYDYIFSTKTVLKEDEAAIQLQAAYRGYRTRRALKEEKAATKIQSAFRGHLARKKLKKEYQTARRIQSVFDEYRRRKHHRHKSYRVRPGKDGVDEIWDKRISRKLYRKEPSRTKVSPTTTSIEEDTSTFLTMMQKKKKKAEAKEITSVSSSTLHRPALMPSDEVTEELYRTDEIEMLKTTSSSRSTEAEDRMFRRGTLRKPETDYLTLTEEIPTSLITSPATTSTKPTGTDVLMKFTTSPSSETEKIFTREARRKPTLEERYPLDYITTTEDKSPTITTTEFSAHEGYKEEKMKRPRRPLPSTSIGTETEEQLDYLVKKPSVQLTSSPEEVTDFQKTTTLSSTDERRDRIYKRKESREWAPVVTSSEAEYFVDEEVKPILKREGTVRRREDFIFTTEEAPTTTDKPSSKLSSAEIEKEYVFSADEVEILIPSTSSSSFLTDESKVKILKTTVLRRLPSNREYILTTEEPIITSEKTSSVTEGTVTDVGGKQRMVSSSTISSADTERLWEKKTRLRIIPERMLPRDYYTTTTTTETTERPLYRISHEVFRESEEERSIPSATSPSATPEIIREKEVKTRRTRESRHPRVYVATTEEITVPSESSSSVLLPRKTEKEVVKQEYPTSSTTEVDKFWDEKTRKKVVREKYVPRVKPTKPSREDFIWKEGKFKQETVIPSTDEELWKKKVVRKVSREARLPRDYVGPSKESPSPFDLTTSEMTEEGGRWIQQKKRIIRPPPTYSSTEPDRLLEKKTKKVKRKQAVRSRVRKERKRKAILERAATKIQSTYRGYRARETMKSILGDELFEEKFGFAYQKGYFSPAKIKQCLKVTLVKSVWGSQQRSVQKQTYREVWHNDMSLIERAKKKKADI